MTANKKIPVVILNGFLGSGKTTLFRNLLYQSKNKNIKVAAVVNDMSALDVDGELLGNLEVIEEDNSLLESIHNCVLSSQKGIQKLDDAINKLCANKSLKLIVNKTILYSLKISLLGCLFMLNACENSNEEYAIEINSINKIMPLGASRVQGARPYYESFRYALWKDLIQNEWSFDFNGTQSDLGSYPDNNSYNFNMDHEGRGGWTSGLILNGLSNWLNETGPPDVVLFSAPGGNDILNSLDYDQTLLNINAIIDLLQADNSNVTILIEQIAPGRTDFMTPEYTAIFNQSREDVLNLASVQSTENSEVIVVDMATGFTDIFLADEIHYNEAGAEFIANRYYEALVGVLE